MRGGLVREKLHLFRKTIQIKNGIIGCIADHIYGNGMGCIKFGISGMTLIFRCNRNEMERNESFTSIN
jgi:hypothetical protein